MSHWHPAVSQWHDKVYIVSAPICMSNCMIMTKEKCDQPPNDKQECVKETCEYAMSMKIRK